MSNVPIAGKLSKLEVKGESGSWETVSGRVDMTLNVNQGEIDASHMDGEDWSFYLEGRRDATIDFSLRYLPGDDGQSELITHYFDAEEDDTFDVRFQTQTSGVKFEAKAFVTSLNISAPDEGAQDMNGTLRIDGAITKS